MEDKRSSAALPMLIALVLFALLLTAYVAGYYLLPEKLSTIAVVGEDFCIQSEDNVRRFRYSWLANVYRPIGIVEGRLRGIPVHVLGENDENPEGVDGFASLVN
jgi:hypothetical protein